MHTLLNSHENNSKENRHEKNDCVRSDPDGLPALPAYCIHRGFSGCMPQGEILKMAIFTSHTHQKGKTMIKALAERLAQAWAEHNRLDELSIAKKESCKDRRIAKESMTRVYEEIQCLESLILCQVGQDHEENQIKLIILASRLEGMVEDYNCIRDFSSDHRVGYSEGETASCLHTIGGLIQFLEKEGYNIHPRLMKHYWSPELHPNPYLGGDMLKAA